MPKRYTQAEIEALASPRGGYSRKTLAKLGVAWPPKKGWKYRLTHGMNPNVDPREEQKAEPWKQQLAFEWREVPWERMNLF